ncbi:hypothetical protein GDO81_008845 [Engystomops pustulosus]|uniref:EF-hand domain-containing protein n=1 Tax=Engystomops pustulosus TaxID=76066 RepID=A0AAV7CI65_ENGPU|nr:hypothetical protein GDO81_008845 [Engystomops pustulosus]
MRTLSSSGNIECIDEDLSLLVYDCIDEDALSSGNEFERLFRLRDEDASSLPAINANLDAAILNGAAPSHEEKDEYNAGDLRDVLNDLLSKREEVKSEGFTLKTCKEMIDSLDEQNTGTLGKVEFKKLCKKLQFYGKLFVEVDANVSGNIDAHEMRNALHRAGFNLSNRIHDVIIRRYITGNRAINFEDFIACMMRLETLFKMFNILDTDKDGKISLSLSEWVCAGLI